MQRRPRRRIACREGLVGGFVDGIQLFIRIDALNRFRGTANVGRGRQRSLVRFLSHGILLILREPFSHHRKPDAAEEKSHYFVGM